MKKRNLLISILIALLISTEAMAATPYYVNYTFVNVRSGPGTKYKLKGRLYEGDKVSVYSIKNGWAKVKIKGKTAYICTDYLSKVSNKNGWICKNGIWDYWSNGKMIPSAWGTHEAFTKIKGTYSGTSYKIVICRSKRMLYLFRAGNGWIPYKQMSICVGKSSTPTPKGSFSLNHKMYKMDSVMPDGKSTEFYAISFYGDYCLHSVLYKYKSSSPKECIDSRLGEAISNGCVRLSTSNAKWIYNNCPSGTSVYIY